MSLKQHGDYSTKATWLGSCYGCRVFYKGKLVVEARVDSKDQIGGAFRDLFRTIDKLEGDLFTNASRKRITSTDKQVKHIWNWSNDSNLTKG